MSMEQLLSFVVKDGFAMVLCVYLMVRMENRLERLTACIQELSRTLGQK